MDFRKLRNGLGSGWFGLLKVLAGALIIWGQYEFQEPGTVYGFSWPSNIHDFFADVRTVNVLILALWLIRSGILGEKRHDCRTNSV